MTKQRVTNLYDLMDAAYDSVIIREHSTAERVNARLKDEFGGLCVRVHGHQKVMAHLMFGILALTVDQLMRFAT